MRIWRIACIAVFAALSGCVIGYGHCLFLAPVKNTLDGKIQFRDYPKPDGIDHVPMLVLDRTAYIYAPAQSHLCLPANDLQLVGMSEFPPDIPENTRIEVEGSLFEALSGHQYTRFVLSVLTIVPILPRQRADPAPAIN